MVDVKDLETRRTGVQHGEERSEATQARAIADARRNGDHGLVDETPDDARQRTFHAGDDDQYACGCEPLAAVEQAVNARDADVVQALDDVPPELGRPPGLFR